MHQAAQVSLGAGLNKQEKQRKHMKTRLVSAVLALVFLMAGQALASTSFDDDAPNCNSRNWVGTYVANSVLNGKNFVVQWQFHNDGTMTVYGTYYLDRLVTEGTGSPGRGVWKCGEDGSVIATWIDASFPSVFVFDNYQGDPRYTWDVELGGHSRFTYKFKIQDRDTLVRKALARRVYSPFEDATIPGGGIINLQSTSERAYSRLKVSEGDLTVTP